MEGHVYKYWASEGDAEWQRFIDFHDGLRRFYRDTANHGESVMMRMTS
jgi:hypothetical protein